MLGMYPSGGAYPSHTTNASIDELRLLRGLPAGTKQRGNKEIGLDERTMLNCSRQVTFQNLGSTRCRKRVRGTPRCTCCHHRDTVRCTRCRLKHKHHLTARYFGEEYPQLGVPAGCTRVRGNMKDGRAAGPHDGSRGQANVTRRQTAKLRACAIAVIKMSVWPSK